MKPIHRAVFLFAFLFSCYSMKAESVATLNLNGSYLEVAGNGAIVKKAALILDKEIYDRAGIHLLNAQKDVNQIRLVVGLESEIKRACPEAAPLYLNLPGEDTDGYKIMYSEVQKLLIISGNDDRGVLYGVGYLLRKSGIANNAILFHYSGNVYSHPEKEYRGIGLRANVKYESFEDRLRYFDDYVKDLVLFGLNSVDLTIGYNPEYIKTAMSYGLKIGIVSFDNGKDFVTTEGVYNELRKREQFFEACPRIDNYTIKSGDPGNLSAKDFFEFTKKEIILLKKYHPEAKVWIAPQKFNGGTRSYFDEFITEILKYDWIDGLVYGPWARFSLDAYRSKLGGSKSIRHFVDIGHIYSAQYPINYLDLPWAISYGRIVINPRPVAMKNIHDRLSAGTVGSIQYSEGSNDDVNKFVWTSLEWNPGADIDDVLLDYSRFFIGPGYAGDFCRGLKYEEASLEGRIDSNRSVNKAYAIFGKLDADTKNGSDVYHQTRYRMGLLRAFFDQYVKLRYLYETQVEREFVNYLRTSGGGFKKAVALEILNRENPSSEFRSLKEKCHKLYSLVYTGEEGMWTDEGQKCILNAQMDLPLNNRDWYLYKLSGFNNEGKETAKEAKILKELRAVASKDQRGAYFNLGSFENGLIEDAGSGYGDDPYYLMHPYIGYGVQMDRFRITRKDFNNRPIRNEWLTQLGRYYDEPLQLEFPIKHPEEKYKLNITYAGEATRYKVKVRLIANGSYVVHDFMTLSPDKYAYQFKIPPRLYKDGKITLTWICGPGERGVNVAEVFFEKE
ncbi:hypothetical protein [Niabella aurantiaca]|uniref:hypothetical protein n=1 Tax=Niabella aurantiaca TaxID=379900 RepID=UPI0003645C5B|nr:hypothetical protein [Niabella aurantiaca]